MKMSKYRLLKGFAYNIAYKFAISANHFAFMAYQGAGKEVHIDLMSGEIEPKGYRKERNEILVQLCVDNFLSLINKNGLDEIQDAIMEVVFDVENKEIANNVVLIPSKIRVRIIDDRGREYMGIYRSKIIAQK